MSDRKRIEQIMLRHQAAQSAAGKAMTIAGLAEAVDREIGYSQVCEVLESVKCWCQRSFTCARCAALAVARGDKSEDKR